MKNIKIFLLYFLLNSITTHSQEETISFLALGDSYTIGTSELAKNNWPNQLTEVLTKKGYKTNTHILAKAGWTTNKLIEEIEKADLNPSYNLVSLLIGVNNQYRGQDIEAFKTDFIVLLKKSIQLAKNDSSNVFVLSIPDWSVTHLQGLKTKNESLKN
jgi:lysophospholipase L1-like esterase